MESQNQRNELLQIEKQKTDKWQTAESLLNAFEETMLQIKEKNSELSQEHVGLVLKGMVRAVNDLEFASESVVDGEEFKFEENENEEPLVTASRHVMRDKLIEAYKESILERGVDPQQTDKKSQVLEAPKVLENYLRLSGIKHLTKIYNMLTLELVNERKRNSSGWLVYSLYNFNAWEKQRDKPQRREFNRRQDDFEQVMEVTEKTLTDTLFDYLEKRSKEPIDAASSDEDIIEGIENAVIDLHMRANIGIVWNELIHRPPVDSDMELLNDWMKGKKFGSKIGKRAEEIRIDLRKKLFKAFEENIKVLRKNHLIRYGSKDDLDDIWKGIAYGVQNFWLSLEDIPYAEKLNKENLLSDTDFEKVTEFISFFEKEGHKSTRFIGSDGRHNKALHAVVLEKINDLGKYKEFLGIVE